MYNNCLKFTESKTKNTDKKKKNDLTKREYINYKITRNIHFNQIKIHLTHFAIIQ